MHVHCHISDAQMWKLIEIVIPNIKLNRNPLLSASDIFHKKSKIKKDSKDSGECCRNLLTDWISTGHIPKPKTYQTL